jgi:hypothetical protein
MASSSQVATEFTLFPNLPLEVRFMILEEALPGPRVVDINVRTVKVDNESINKFWTSEPIVVLANVNADTRRVCLKKYQHFNGLLVSFDIDTVHFTRSVCESEGGITNLFLEHDLSLLKHVAINEYAFSDERITRPAELSYPFILFANLIYVLRHIPVIGIVIEPEKGYEDHRPPPGQSWKLIPYDSVFTVQAASCLRRLICASRRRESLLDRLCRWDRLGCHLIERFRSLEQWKAGLQDRQPKYHLLVSGKIPATRFRLMKWPPTRIVWLEEDMQAKTTPHV